jgi:hypothetical protein
VHAPVESAGYGACAGRVGCLLESYGQQRFLDVSVVMMAVTDESSDAGVSEARRFILMLPGGAWTSWQ